MSSWWWQLLGGRAPKKGSVVIGWPPVSAMNQAVWKGPTTQFLRDLLTMAIRHLLCISGMILQVPPQKTCSFSEPQKKLARGALKKCCFAVFFFHVAPFSPKNPGKSDFSERGGGRLKRSKTASSQIREPKKLILEMAMVLMEKPQNLATIWVDPPGITSWWIAPWVPPSSRAQAGVRCAGVLLGGETRGGCWKNQPCRYYLLPGTQITSLFEGQAPKTRPTFQSKPGSFGFQVLKMVIF